MSTPPATGAQPAAPARRRSARTRAVVLALAALILVLALVEMASGTIRLSPTDMLGALTGAEGVPSRTLTVVREIRLPRVLTALAVGACLGAAGAVFQSISRNALGSPDIIGFTTGAATGAVAQIVIFDAGPVATALGAVAGGLGAAGLVYLLSLRGGVTGGYRLILVGIGIGAMLGALNALMLAKGDMDLAAEAHLWLSGSLAGRNWGHALPVLAGVVVLLPVMLRLGRDLSIMEMGDDTSRGLGVRAERQRIVAMAAGVGATALATAAAGPIAFVALAAPQLASRLTRSSAVPIGTGAMLGAVLMAGCDALTQQLPLRAGIPIGLMTGLVGGCYLLWLLTRSQRI